MNFKVFKKNIVGKAVVVTTHHLREQSLSFICPSVINQLHESSSGQR